MHELDLKKLINQYAPYGKMDDETRTMLFKQYAKDKENNVPPHESWARTILIVGNKKLIHTIVQKHYSFDKRLRDDSEIYDYAFDGLINAIDLFDLNKNIKFSTYASTAILRRVQRYFYDKEHEVSTVQFCDLTVETNKEGKEIEFDVADPYNLVEDVSLSLERKNKYFRIVSCFIHLTQKEQEAIMYEFGMFGKPQISWSKRCIINGNSRQMENIRLNSALDKIKLILKTKELTEDEIIKRGKIKRKIFQLIPEAEQFLNQFKTGEYISL